jgi:hypothetical protein
MGHKPKPRDRLAGLDRLSRGAGLCRDLLIAFVVATCVAAAVLAVAWAVGAATDLV